MAGIADRRRPPLTRGRWAAVFATLAAVFCLWLATGQEAFANYTDFEVESYDYLSNELSLDWSDPTTFGSSSSGQGHHCYLTTHGTYLYDNEDSLGKIGPCNISSFTGTTVPLPKTDSSISLRIRTNHSRRTNVAHYPDRWTSYSDTYSWNAPDAVDISSATYSSSTGQISLIWTADDSELQAETDTVYWHYFATLSDSTSDLTSAQYGLLATGSDVRTATIDADDVFYTLGQEFHLWVYATTDSLSTEMDYDTAAGNSHFLTFSLPEAITIGSLTDCDSDDIVDVGYLYGYGFDVTGRLDATTCSVDAGVESGYGDTSKSQADVYKFKIATARDTTLTFIPVTPFQAGSGQYRFRIRSNSLEGNVLFEEAGTGDITTSSGLALGGGLTYVVEVIRYGIGGSYGYSFAISYGFIEPPTPTPYPTPTPRVQPNLDFRLHPNPGGIAYTAGTVYSLEPEGGAGFFPVTVRSANPAALELSLISTITCDTTADDEVEADEGDTLYVKACTAGHNTTLTVISGGGDLLAQYSVYVRGGPVPTPAPATVSQGVGADVSKRDELGFGIILGVVCGGFGVGCDTDLITILVVMVGAVIVMAFLLRRSRGAATSMSVGVAATFALLVLMLGYLWLGFPLWLVVLVLIPVLAVGGIAAVVRFRQVG